MEQRTIIQSEINLLLWGEGRIVHLDGQKINFSQVFSKVTIECWVHFKANRI